jgi:DNA-binding protein HU-beta
MLSGADSRNERSYANRRSKARKCREKKRSEKLNFENFNFMNKDQLIEAIAAKTGASKKEGADALEAIIDTIISTLKKDDKVAISGFGTFQVSKRAARAGVNPKTGAKIQIPAMKVPKFKAGKGLKEAVR